MHYSIRKSDGEYLQEVFDTVEEAKEKAEEHDLKGYTIIGFKEALRGTMQEDGTIEWEEVD